MFHLLLNSMDSGVKVKYQILDHNNELVTQNVEPEDRIVGFGVLTPLLNPKEALEHPYTLQLLYEHQHHKSDGTVPECPKVELHFVLEPAREHAQALQCDDSEYDWIHK